MDKTELALGTGGALVGGVTSSLIKAYAPGPVRGVITSVPELPGAAVGMAGLALAKVKGMKLAGQTMAFVGFSLGLLALGSRVGVTQRLGIQTSAAGQEWQDFPGSTSPGESLDAAKARRDEERAFGPIVSVSYNRPRLV
jgi:hypothetical protein